VVTFSLEDSYGDGWGGNSLVFGEEILTIDGWASEASYSFCLADGDYGYDYVPAETMWNGENSWTISDDLGTLGSGTGTADMATYSFTVGGDVVLGCTDEAACNYNAEATDDDGSCEYPPEGFDCAGDCADSALSLTTFNLIDSYGDGWNGNSLVFGDDTLTVASGLTASFAYCLADGDYGYDYDASGAWHAENSWNITDVDGNILGNGFGAPADELQAYTFTVGGEIPVYGCTDENALNYDENANSEDGSCLYTGSVCIDALPISAGDHLTNGSQLASYWTFEVTGPGELSVDIGSIFDVTGIYGSCDETDGFYDDVLNSAYYSTSYYFGLDSEYIGSTVIIGAGVFGYITTPAPVTIGWNPDVPGCMDPNSDNYNPDANVDDGSCVCSLGHQLTVGLSDSYGDGWNGNALTIGGDTPYSFTLASGDTATHSACLADGAYAIACDGGSFQGEVSWTISEGEATIMAGGAPFSGVLELGDVDPIPGCMDEAACNYDPNANVDIGCVYPGENMDCALEADFPFSDENSTAGRAHDHTFTNEGLYCEWAGTYYPNSSGQIAPDVVYSMSLAEDTPVLASLCGSGYDTALGIFTSSGTQVAGNDDATCSDGQLWRSELVCDLPAGDYFVVVSGYGSASGDYTLNVSEWAPPPCADDDYEDDDTKETATDHGADGTFEYLSCSDDNFGGIAQPSGWGSVDWSVVSLASGSLLSASTTNAGGSEFNDIDLFIEDINGDGVCQHGDGDDLAGSGNQYSEEYAQYFNGSDEDMVVYVGVIYYGGENPIPYSLTLAVTPIPNPDAPQNLTAELFGFPLVDDVHLSWEPPFVAASPMRISHTPSGTTKLVPLSIEKGTPDAKKLLASYSVDHEYTEAELLEKRMNLPPFQIPSYIHVGRTEDFTVTLWDSYGDGWDGAFMDVLVNEVVVLDSITVEHDSWVGGIPHTWTFAVDNGDLVETIYTSGNYESEHSYAFYDNIGTMVAADGPSPGTGIGFTVEVASGVVGCMDDTACNYNPDATIEGECEFAGAGFDCEGNCLDASLAIVSFNLVDTYGDGWNGNSLVFGDDILTIANGSSASFPYCLADGDYDYSYDASGSYEYENNWTIETADGIIGSGVGASADELVVYTFTVGEPALQGPDLIALMPTHRLHEEFEVMVHDFSFVNIGDMDAVGGPHGIYYNGGYLGWIGDQNEDGTFNPLAAGDTLAITIGSLFSQGDNSIYSNADEYAYVAESDETNNVSPVLDEYIEITCLDDDYEDNDFSSSAALIESGTYELVHCFGDVDWFSATVANGQMLRLTVTEGVMDVSGAMDVGLWVFDADPTYAISFSADAIYHEITWANTSTVPMDAHFAISNINTSPSWLGDIEGTYTLTVELLEFEQARYSVYRDGSMIVDDQLETVYNDMDVEPGDHAYTVTASFGGVEGSHSNTASVTVEFVEPPPAATDLVAESACVGETGEDAGIRFSWTHEDYAMFTDCSGQEVPEGFLMYLGDGVCDEGAYGVDLNCAAYEYDGGDCGVNCEGEWAACLSSLEGYDDDNGTTWADECAECADTCAGNPDVPGFTDECGVAANNIYLGNCPDPCASECEAAGGIESWIGDGYCDNINNNEACSLDGGDCCPCTCVDATYSCETWGGDCLDCGVAQDAAAVCPDECSDGMMSSDEFSVDRSAEAKMAMIRVPSDNNLRYDLVRFVITLEYMGTPYEFYTFWNSIDLGVPEGGDACATVVTVGDDFTNSEPSNEACAVSGCSSEVDDITVVVDYSESWNMLSLAVGTDANAPNDVFGETVGVYGYPYSDPVEGIENGQGYWVRYESGGTSLQTGAPIEALTVSVSEGWNMLGSISEAASIGDPEEIVVSLYGYPYSVPVDAIEPGKGYWVRATSAGSITFTPGGGDLSRTREIDANSLTINGMKLHFGVEVTEEMAWSYGLPPKPPAGSFDVRFSGDTKIAESSGAIEVMNNTNELEVNYSIIYDAGAHMLWALTTATGEEFILDGMGSILLPGNVEGLSLSKVPEVPANFALTQNFPNPFNPVTNISFQLPVTSNVTVSVYNMMGQKVVELVQGSVDAGYHSVMWDSRDLHGEAVSSGVYLYTITAGDYQAVKKMVLMK